MAEKNYSRSLEASKNLDSADQMSVLFDLTFNVYQTWGRYNEAITNYETLLGYYKSKEEKNNVFRNSQQPWFDSQE